MTDSTQSINKFTQRFLSGTLLSRLTGMVRDIAMAYAFGTHAAVAAFMVAFRLSQLPRRLLGEGALQSAFVPQFEELRKSGHARAYTFFFNLSIALSLLLLIIVGVTCAGIGGWLAFGALSPGNGEIAYLTLLMMPGLLFICLYGLNTALLQCEKSYFIGSAAPIAFNLVWIAAAVTLGKFTPEAAMPWLSAAIVIGCLCQWLITVPRVISKFRQQFGAEGFHLFSSIDLRSKDLAKLIKPLLLSIMGVAAAQVNSALDPLFARYADPEGPALLWYALRIQQLPLALFGIALSGALLPPLTRAIKAKDTANFCLFLSFAIRRCSGLLLPITFGIVVLGDACINVLYGRGDFTDYSTAQTTQCLWAYAAGLLPMALVLVLAPAFYAQSNYRIPTIASLLSVAINLFLNTVMIVFLGCGAAGIAWATSLAAWFNVLYLAYALQKIYAVNVLSSLTGWNSCKVLAAGLTATLGTLGLQYAFWSNTGQAIPAWSIVWGITPSLPRAFIAQFMYAAVAGLSFLAILLAAAWLYRAEDILSQFAMLFSRAKNKSAEGNLP